MPEWGLNPRSPTFQAGGFNNCTRPPALEVFKQLYESSFDSLTHYLSVLSTTRPIHQSWQQSELDHTQQTLDAEANISRSRFSEVESESTSSQFWIKATQSGSQKSILVTLWIRCDGIELFPDTFQEFGLQILTIRQIRHIEPMLAQCRPTVCDAGPTLNQYCFNMSCLLRINPLSQ